MAKVGHRAIGASFAQVIRWGRENQLLAGPRKGAKEAVVEMA
jgi:hypothetical protein